MSQLAGRWRRLLLLYGLGWTAAAVLLTVIVLGLADYFIRFQDRGVRTICTLGVLVVLGWAVQRFLWPALRARSSSVQLAQRVEKRFPGLTDRLASTMYFLGQEDNAPGAGSAALRRAVVHQTSLDTADLNLNEALDVRPTRRALTAASVVGVIAVLLAVAAPQSAQVALLRLVNPWGGDAWPQRNHLAFVTPITRIASGQNFEVEIIDSRGAKLPDQVWIEYRRTSVDGDVTEERQPAKFFGDALVARQEGVTRSFEYRAVGGDDDLMPWIAVEVLEPPAIDKLSILLEYPAYTGWPPQSGDQQLRALVGTRVGLTATVSKPLRAARLCRDGAEPLALPLNADLHGFALAPNAEPGFAVEQNGNYWFELEDVDGLIGGTDLKYEVRAIPDNPPTVAIEEPATDLHVTPQATIPLKISAKDDLAVASIGRLIDRSDHSDQESQRTVLFAGPAQVEAKSSAGLGAAEGGEQRVVDERWDLQLLELKPGTQLTLRASARDYRPAESISQPRRITIISPAELDERLAERQAFVAAELARTLKLEQEARAQVAALKIQMREVGKLGDADLDRLQNAEMAQRQISRSLSGKGDGLRAQVASVMAELANNRVDQPDVAERMQSLADDLDRLTGEPLPAIERNLTSARKQSQAAENGQPAVTQALDQAGEQQDQVIATLEKQLAEMSRWDSHRQFHRDLAQVRRDQERINEETAKLGRETLTKDLQALTQQERADLQKLADEQQVLGRRFEKVERQMQDAASKLTGDDAATAETLTDAVREARQSNLARQMGEAGKNVGSNQIGQAVAVQKKVLEQLGEMLDILGNRQESSLARLVEKLKTAENELAEMRKTQAGLRKQIDEASKIADPVERKRQLERLAKQEQELAEKAQAMARRLERLQANSASRSSSSAAKSLGKSGQAGSQGDAGQAGESARQAEKDLEQAQAEAANSRRQAEMDLAFEQLTKMQDQLAALRSRQQEVVGEAERLEGIRQSSGRLSRGQAESVGQLGREQRQVGAETSQMAEKLASAEAFALALRRATEEMSRAAEKFDHQQTDATAQGAARRALRRLELLLSALEADSGGDNKQQPEGQEGESPSGGSGGGQSGQGDGIAEIAQLKLIKLLQQEVNTRTRDLDQSLGGKTTLTPEEQQEYTQLSEEQGQLADLIRNLTPVTEKSIEDDPARLPDARESDNEAPPGEAHGSDPIEDIIPQSIDLPAEVESPQ